MSHWLIAVVGLLYGAACVEQAYKGNYWVALMLAGYVIANVALFKLAS